MTETWVLKTTDGEKYTLKTNPDPGDLSDHNTYQLLKGASGHHGMPTTVATDPIPKVAGGELRNVTRDIRTLYAPTRVVGRSPADAHKKLEKFRKSTVFFDPNSGEEHELWITNEEGQTRYASCIYSKGFEGIADDEKKAPNSYTVPLYLLCHDPYFYDPPGAGITRTFAQEPWDRSFLTHTVTKEITQEAHAGDTTLKVADTANCIVGKPIEIVGSKFHTTDQSMPEMSMPLKVQGGLKAGGGGLLTSITSVSADNGNPALNQLFHVMGTVTSLSSGKPISGATVTISQNVTQTNICTNGQCTQQSNVNIQQNICTTNSNGQWSLEVQGIVDGIFTFIAEFLGDLLHIGSKSATSVKIGAVQDTTITLACSNNANPAINHAFTLSGTLKSGKTALAAKKITLFKKTPSGYATITSTNTDKNGAYSFTQKVGQACYMQYMATFAGQADKEDESGILAPFWEWFEQHFLGDTDDNYKASSASLTVTIDSPTFPVEYLVALPPSMINDGEIQFFCAPAASQNFRGVACIAETSDDSYATELSVIEAQGLWHAIDISVVTRDTTYALSHWHSWLVSLQAAGWTNVIDTNYNISTRTGNNDPATYLAGLGFTFINKNGLPLSGSTNNPDAVSTHTHKNSLVCLTAAAVPFIENCVSAAVPAHIGSGILAGVWPNDTSKSNEILANSIANVCPDYHCLFDWSVLNFTTMTNFVAWFHPNYAAAAGDPRHDEAEQVSLYKSLGFPMLMAQLQAHYPSSFSIDGAGPYTWLDPATHGGARGVLLTLSYTDIPLTFKGTLTNVVTGHSIVGETINLQMRPSTELSMQCGSILTLGYSAGHVLHVASTDGFADGNSIKVTGGGNTSTGTIATNGVDPVGLTITLVGTLNHIYSAGSGVSNNVLHVKTTSGFVAAETITVAGFDCEATPVSHSETATISAVDSNAMTITLSAPLTNTYAQLYTSTTDTTPTSVSEAAFKNWTNQNTHAAVTAMTGTDGSWSVTLIDDTAVQPGKHIFRAYYAGNVGTSPNYMPFTAPTTDGMHVIHRIITTVKRVRETTQIAAVDRDKHPFVVDLATPLINDYLLAPSAPYSPWFVETDNLDQFLSASPRHNVLLTADADVGGTTVQIADTSTCNVGDPVTISSYPASGAVYFEHNVVEAISGTTVTLVSDLANTYLMSDGAEYNEVLPTTPRIVNDCDIVLLWMNGCPPCYAAKAQLEAAAALYPSINLHQYELHVNNTDGTLNTDIIEANLLWPDAIQFAKPRQIVKCPVCGGTGKLIDGTICSTCSGTGLVNVGGCCGPAIAAWGPQGAVYGDIMPAVIAVYRDGLLLKAYCGVHTTQADPVPTDVILDEIGPRSTWRIGSGSIAMEAVITNNGDDIAYPVWTFTGPGRNPRVTNVTTDTPFILEHDLSKGENVTVDCNDKVHSCSSDKNANYLAAGYYKTETCPTCGGAGVIPACPTCGGAEVCPTCHGAKVIKVWVPSVLGSVAPVGGLYNLRAQIESDGRNFWGFYPGANVIAVELGLTKVGVSQVVLNLVQRYEGI